jgi:hypothetical protein
LAELSAATFKMQEDLFLMIANRLANETSAAGTNAQRKAPHTTRIVRLALLLSIWPLANLAAAADWPAWRGPTGIGWTDETDLPLSWDGKTGDGVLWKAPLAGTTGHSCPIVWGDRVFLTTSAKQTREQEARKEIPEHHIECYQAADGKLLWRTLIPPGQEVAGYSIYASPTPATDGKAVYAWFGSAVIAAVDFEGKLIWRHERKGPFVLNPGICTSPILYQDTVILLCDQGRNQGNGSSRARGSTIATPRRF